MTENIAQTVTGYMSHDDIVFEHRNKEYGAYDMRKKYKRYLLFGFFISFFIVGTAVVVPLIKSYYNKNNKVVRVDKTTTVIMEDLNDQEDAPPPPPPPPPPAAIQAQVAFVAPKVVDSVVVEVEMASTDDQVQTAVAEAPPTDLTTTVEAAPEVVQEEPAFIVVEEEAAFQGGDLNSFRNWIQSNLNYPELAAENGSEGKVFIQFAVNSKGEICDVRVVRSSGDPLLDAEAVRVIKKSPAWQPARQSGKSVKQQFTLPIMFKLQ